MFWIYSWVLVEDSKGKQSLASSAGFLNYLKFDLSAVQFPNEYVEAASKKGFQSATVGSEIAKANNGVNELDPHSFLTKNSTSREELLIQALIIAIGQL